MIDQKLLKKYAEVIVKVGANVQKGQPVVIGAIVESYPLTRYVVEECYKAGASTVYCRYDDSFKTRCSYLYEDLKTLKTIPSWFVPYQSDPVLKEGACRIAIRGSSPDAYKGCDPVKMMEVQKVTGPLLKPLSNWVMSGKCQWTIACYPTPEWAKMVFPKEKDVNVAIDKLWAAILSTVRVDGKTDAIKAWNAHNNETDARAKALNALNLDYIHVTNKLGTDLKLKLVNNHIWLAGRETGAGNKWKAPFTANLPTEEVWSMPDKDGLNGKVFSSKPLSYQGNLIDKFWFEFKNGEVVKYDAKVGKEQLDNIFKIPGSKRTGEIALVPVSSPINQSGVIFYSTLFDENAACHIALGASYPNNIKGGTNKSREELSKLGSNDSLVHIDFMFGTADTNIIGYDKKGKAIEIMKAGKILF